MRDTFLPYCAPAIGASEIAAVADSLSAGWLTTGPVAARFERDFSAACGARFAVALNSCTAGLHLALVATGIGPGDEVVTPSLTFVAGAQCIIETGARPVFCDVDPQTLSVSLRSIASVVTPKTKAIVVMPYAGRPLGIERLADFARERGIALIEDAAHAAGTLDAGVWPGTHSSCAVFSFYATKNLTTGEGGMLVTNDERLADRVRRLALHGMSRDAWQRYSDRGTWRYDVTEPGYKYNISDLAASLGVVQLGRLEEMQRRRSSIAERYLGELGGLPGISFQRDCSRPGDRHSWCMFPLLVDSSEAGIDRDALVDAMREHNIGTSVHYIPTHSFSFYRHLASGPLPNTERIAENVFSLPLYPVMSDRDVDDVVEAVRAIVPGRKALTMTNG